jgi:hypothetical protein
MNASICEMGSGIHVPLGRWKRIRPRLQAAGGARAYGGGLRISRRDG